MSYDGTLSIFTRRIYDLIPTHPEIMEIDPNDPWPLTRIRALAPVIKTIAPSLGQAASALEEAQHLYRISHEETAH